MDAQTEHYIWNLVDDSVPLQSYQPEYVQTPYQEWNITQEYFVYEQPSKISEPEIEMDDFPQDWEATRLDELDKLCEYCENYVSNGYVSDDWKREIVELVPDWTRGNEMEPSHPIIEDLPSVIKQFSKPKRDRIDMNISKLHSALLTIDSQLAANLMETENSTLYDNDSVPKKAVRKVQRRTKRNSETKVAQKPSKKVKTDRSSQATLDNWPNGPINPLYPYTSTNQIGHVVIGPFGTTIPMNGYVNIDWAKSAATITKQLLLEVFDRDVLATHKLPDNPVMESAQANPTVENNILDMSKVSDIIFLVRNNKPVTMEDILYVIAGKCLTISKRAASVKEKRIMDKKNWQRWQSEGYA